MQRPANDSLHGTVTQHIARTQAAWPATACGVDEDAAGELYVSDTRASANATLNDYPNRVLCEECERLAYGLRLVRTPSCCREDS